MNDKNINQKICSNLDDIILTEGKTILSIVVPAYYEEDNIKYLYDGLIKILEDIKLSWELIFVDDGSTDRTWFEIIKLNKIDNRVKGLRFSRNFGHQYALYAGFNFASGKAVISMDADMQHPPQVIPLMLAEWKKGYKIVNTIRIDNENTKLIKRFTSKWFYKIFSYLSGAELQGGMADFRLLDEQVVQEFLKFKENGLFLRGIVEWLGYPSTAIEFKSHERLHGETKYNFKRMIKFGWEGITAFSLKPLRLGIILGIMTSIFSFSQLSLALYDYFIRHATVPGWTTLVVLNTFLFSILFVILGIIGEYIGRILIETRGRPRFIISDSLGLRNNLIRSFISLNENELQLNKKK